MSPRSSFGSVYRKHRRDGTEYDGWFVRFVQAGRRVERGAFATKKHAETYLAARCLEKSELRALGLPELRRVLVKDLIADAKSWYRAHWRVGGLKSRFTQLKHLESSVGDRFADEVTREMVLAHFDRLRRERGYATSSLHNALRVVSGLFRWAEERRHVRANPCRGLYSRLPRLDVEERPYLTPEELRRLYASVSALVRPAVVLIGEAGLRRAEAVHLTWQEVAADHSTVTVRAYRAKGHRARVVPLTQTAREVLEELRLSRVAPLRGEDRVFPFADATLNHHFRTGAIAAGLPHLAPHGLRHAFASGLVRAGVDLPTVSRLLGHRDIKTTMLYASHAPRNAGELAIAALERARHADPPPDSQARKAT